MISNLYPHQLKAVSQLKTGSILCGGVGSGKTMTSLGYFYSKVCEDMKKPRDLYVITTAAKRDSLDWEREASLFGIIPVVDSWNNIKKYVGTKNSFFIFDEQRLLGSGAWVKSFLKIVKTNDWILLSATPGDSWMDYIPVFIANGFYKNRSHFLLEHVVYSYYHKYPKIDHFVEQGILMKHKKEITVMMDYEKKTLKHHKDILVEFNHNEFEKVLRRRWNPYTNEPIKEVGEYFFVMRKIVNSDPSRLDAIVRLSEMHNRIIVFYNFDYELEMLRGLKTNHDFSIAEYNGHKHEAIPQTRKWIYLVQYISGSEGWNCIETNAIIFYSLNYSHRIMTQASGRIDRINTPFQDLYYYNLISNSRIDTAILKALKSKKDFNENRFATKT